MDEPEQQDPELNSSGQATTSFDIEDIKRRAEQFQGKIGSRNLLEWLAAAFVALWFGHSALTTENTTLMVGGWMVVAGAIGIVVFMVLKGRVQVSLDPNSDPRAFAQAYAEALLAQARLLRTVPIWYLAPLGAGMLTLLAGFFSESGGDDPILWLYSALVVAVFAAIAWMNRRAAGKLQAEAETLLAQLD